MAIDIFEYHDYRKFLNTYLEDKKKKNASYSIRQLCRSAGIKSSGFLSMVLRGQKNLTAATINKLSAAIKLNKKQSEYFEAMVLSNQGKTQDERQRYLDKMVQLKPTASYAGIKKDQYEFLSKPYFSVIHQMVKPVSYTHLRAHETQ